MGETEEGGYSYSHIFAATVLFSALANVSFTTYLFVRSAPMTSELYLVAVAFCAFYAALGQRASRINGLGMIILAVSSFSVVLTNRLFFDYSGISTIAGDVAFYSFACGLFALVAWVLLTPFWSFLQQRSIDKKRWAAVSATLAVVAFGSILVMFYNSTIVSFFDSHPWITTLIAIAVSSVVAYIVGGRRSRGKG